ncbi:MAG: tetratricopeptide repeat protein [Patescibacteria group bacterium]
MPTLEGRFQQADSLRNNARVEEAIAEYLEIARLAEQDGLMLLAARAMQMAGVSAKEAVSRPDSTKFRDALKYFQAAELLFRQEQSLEDLGNLYRDLAIIHDYAGLGAQALAYFQQSLELLEKTDSTAALAITYDKLGLHFFKKNDLEAALAYINRAFEIFKRDRGHGFYQATTMLDLARVLTKKGDDLEAMDWATQSLSWYEADHGAERYDRRRAQLYGLLSILYDRLGEDKKAHESAQKFEKLVREFDIEAGRVLRHDLEEVI